MEGTGEVDMDEEVDGVGVIEVVFGEVVTIWPGD